MNRIHTALLVLATCFVAPLTSLAAPVTVPSGLNPGDQYRLAFVTSTTRDATSGAIADYNAFVAAAAAGVPELAALGTTWQAIGSTMEIDARDNTGTNPLLSTGVPIFRLDGVEVAQDNADLWDGSPSAPINTTEQGTAFAGTIVWSGTETDGTAVLPFSNQLGSGNPLNGSPSSVAPVEYQWIMFFSPAGATENASFYAISGVITVVPEPATYVLAAFGAIGLLAFRRRRG
jgi:hypothetical protein